MKNVYKSTLFLFFVILKSVAYSQCVAPSTMNCDPATSRVMLATPASIEFVFDSFSEYNGGITLNGSTIIRLKIFSLAGAPDPCKWKLSMIVLNGSWPAPSEWESLASYGGAGSGSKPNLDLLQIKVDNGCHTPIGSGIWQTFSPTTGSSIDIINSTTLTPAGDCTTNVNGAGTYLSNYNEYSFTIDYRIQPGLGLLPGRYELGLKFCIVEM